MKDKHRLVITNNGGMISAKGTAKEVNALATLDSFGHRGKDGLQPFFYGFFLFVLGLLVGIILMIEP